jgi:hypothetical protein
LCPASKASSLAKSSNLLRLLSTAREKSHSCADGAYYTFMVITFISTVCLQHQLPFLFCQFQTSSFSADGFTYFTKKIEVITLELHQPTYKFLLLHSSFSPSQWKKSPYLRLTLSPLFWIHAFQLLREACFSNALVITIILSNLGLELWFK